MNLFKIFKKQDKTNYEKEEAADELLQPKQTKRWQAVYNNIINIHLSENEDDTITEIMFSAYNQIRIEKDGAIYSHDTNSQPVFKNNDDYLAFIRNLSSSGDASLADDNPIVSVDVEGLRVTIAWRAITNGTPYVSIRRPTKNKFTLEELVSIDMLPFKEALFLAEQLKEGANIMIAGISSSGKTTLLAALLEKLPAEERIAILEDTPEIAVSNEENRNILKLKSKIYTTAPSKNITIARLVKESLRLNVKKIIIGEVRDSVVARELLDVIQTGHAGSATTIHAESAIGTLQRLENLILQAMSNQTQEAIAFQVARAIDIVVHITKDSQGKYISEICNVKNYDPRKKEYTLEHIYKSEKRGGAI